MSSLTASSHSSFETPNPGMSHSLGGHLVSQPTDDHEDYETESLRSFPCDNPTIPAMRHERARLHTFGSGTWPINRLRCPPVTLARSGLYYLGTGDQCRCFYCGGGLQDWSGTDDPWMEHAKWYPTCEYLLHERGQAWVNSVREQFPNIQPPNLQRIQQQQLQQIPSRQLPSVETSRVENQTFNHPANFGQTTQNISNQMNLPRTVINQRFVEYGPSGASLPTSRPTRGRMSPNTWRRAQATAIPEQTPTSPTAPSSFVQQPTFPEHPQMPEHPQRPEHPQWPEHPQRPEHPQSPEPPQMPAHPHWPAPPQEPEPPRSPDFPEPPSPPRITRRTRTSNTITASGGGLIIRGPNGTEPATFTSGTSITVEGNSIRISGGGSFSLIRPSGGGQSEAGSIGSLNVGEDVGAIKTNLEQMGFAPQEIDAAINRYDNRSGRGPITLEAILDELQLDAGEPERYVPPPTQPASAESNKESSTEQAPPSHTPCVVCLENVKEMVLVPCGHFCTCRSCARHLNRCPICRTHIERTVRFFEA